MNFTTNSRPEKLRTWTFELLRSFFEHLKAQVFSDQFASSGLYIKKFFLQNSAPCPYFLPDCNWKRGFFQAQASVSVNRKKHFCQCGCCYQCLYYHALLCLAIQRFFLQTGPSLNQIYLGKLDSNRSSSSIFLSELINNRYCWILLSDVPFFFVSVDYKRLFQNEKSLDIARVGFFGTPDFLSGIPAAPQEQLAVILL